MRNAHENVVDRAGNALDFYKNNKALIDPVKILQTGFAKLGELNSRISEIRPIGEMGTDNYSNLRDETKKRAAIVACACAGPLRSFAGANNLASILAVVPASKTAYSQGRGKLILNRLATLRKHYDEQLPNMTDYNTSQDKLNALDAIIAEIQEVISLPSNMVTARKLTNVDINDTATEITALFNNVLLPNMLPFQLDNSVLYAAWVEASRVIHTPASHLSAEAALAKAEAKFATAMPPLVPETTPPPVAPSPEVAAAPTVQVESPATTATNGTAPPSAAVDGGAKG